MAIPDGFCHCGCGQKTELAKKTIPGRRHVKGQPLFYVLHHNKGPIKHGHSWKLGASVEYYTWQNMRYQCANPKTYRGKKGIKVCERWQNSFENFLADMGSKPAGHYIDRIDNDGNYEPSNCRWVTPKVSIKNRGKYTKRWRINRPEQASSNL